MHKLAQPVTLWHWGPYFRHERPQSGRFRGFNQLGAEAIGSDSPLVDAELIILLDELFREAGSPGHPPAARQSRLRRLEGRLPRGAEGVPTRARAGARAERARADRSQPDACLRLRRPGHSPGDGGGANDARALGEDDAEHFAAVRGVLDRAGITYQLDPTLVRGLDYYTRTVFEFESDRLGAQAALGGGGRYDGLVERLGGPATPACGWAAGIERIVLALDEDEGERDQRLRRSVTAGASGPRACSRVAAGRPARRARPRRSVAQGPNEAGGSPRCPGGDRSRRGGARAASGHGEWRAARLAHAVEALSAGGAPRPDAEIPALRPNEYRDAWCGQVLADLVGSEPRLAGWVHRRRDHGGLVFIDLRDRTGLVQLVFDPDEAGEAFALSRRLRPEDVVTVAGPVVARPETVNPELPTGEFEPRSATRPCSATPTAPVRDRGFGEVGEEMRLRHRYLDLRRERMRGAIELRHAVAKAIRDFLSGRASSRSRRRCSRARRPRARATSSSPRAANPAPLCLPQSPQLFKQLLMVAGFERYFQIVRCFRDEDQRADRQPDFTQLDVEMSFVGVEDVRPQRAAWRRCSKRWAGRRSSCPCGGSATRRCRATAPTALTCASGSSWSS